MTGKWAWLPISTYAGSLTAVGQGFMQHVQVAPSVVVVQEARQSIVAALDQAAVSGQIETRVASHTMSFVAAAENGTCRSLIPRS